MIHPILRQGKLGACTAGTAATAILGFLLILCIPLVNPGGSAGRRAAAFILAAVFWGSMAAEFFCGLSCRERRRIAQKAPGNKELEKSLPGLVSFFKNPESTAADAALFLSAGIVAVLAWTRVKAGWLIVAGAAFLFLSFQLHCVLNGRNYRQLRAMILYKKEHEKDE